MLKKKLVLFLVTLTAYLFLKGDSCASTDTPSTNAKIKTITSSIKATTIATHLQVPWEIAFINEKDFLITERPGRLRLFKNGQLLKKAIKIFKDVLHVGEAGLMGLALHKDFTTNKWLYLCYATGSKKDINVQVKRYTLENNELKNEKSIIRDIPSAQYHAGCRLAFGPDGYLYITTGDGLKRKKAQDLNSLLGKTLRVTADGKIPKQNPFFHQKGKRPEIFSYGHRNAQGITFEPKSTLMYQSEHGPSGFDGPGGGDEINLIKKGKNYGWPIIHHDETHKNMESPLIQFTPAIAPAAITFYNANLIKGLKGNLLMATLRGKSLYFVMLKDKKVVKVKKFFENEYGRIRVVKEGPKGAIYIATSNRDGRGSPHELDDRIIKLAPN